MHAERLLLETDHLGNLKNVPKLPPNKQVEAIILISSESSETTPTALRTPHLEIAGKTLITGDIFNTLFRNM